MLGAQGPNADPRDDAGVDAARDRDDGATPAELADGVGGSVRKILDARRRIKLDPDGASTFPSGPLIDPPVRARRRRGAVGDRFAESMASIRPLEREDLPAVASLLRAQLPGWSRSEEFLAASLLDHPLVGEEPDSLVAVDGGDIVGFIGAQERRLRFDDRELRGVCVSQLAALPDRGPATGGLLLSRILSGSQDMTWADSVTDLVTRMWHRFGGGIDQTRAADWMLVLRPARWVANAIAESASRRAAPGRATVPVGALSFQAAGPRLARRAFPPPPEDATSEDASATDIVEQLPALNRRVRLRVDYDAELLDHQLTQIESLVGPLVRRVVRRGETPVGWYVYVPRKRSAGRVLHLSALDPHTDTVLSELVDDARERHVAVLCGRAEPHLHWALRDRFAALGYALQPAVAAPDPEVRATLATSASLLTELDNADSELWFREQA